MIAIRRILSFIAALARELSDENAYARHLRLTGHTHSVTEWKEFIDSKHRRKYENAKCC